jgi:hypothetical protein
MVVTIVKIKLSHYLSHQPESNILELEIYKRSDYITVENTPELYVVCS